MRKISDKSEREFENWRAKYEAAIAEYEAMAESRRIRKIRRRTQAKQDEWLRREDEIDRRYVETHQFYDPIENYFRCRMESGRWLWQFLEWSISSVGSIAFTSVIAPLIRKLETKTINHIEKLLWRKRKNLEMPTDQRSAAEKERRKIRRRSTLSPQPTPDEIRKAWLVKDDSCTSIIAFGAMIHDLECFVDNHLAFDEFGAIVGREAGILGWIRENVPELAVRYKTIMRYKSIAKRCRQYLGLKDPQPLDSNHAALTKLLKNCPSTQKDVRERLDAALKNR